MSVVVVDDARGRDTGVTRATGAALTASALGVEMVVPVVEVVSLGLVRGLWLKLYCAV